MNEKGKSTLEIYKQIIKVKNYSENTIKTYTHYVDVFLKSQSKSCLNLTAADFQSYIYNYPFKSVSQQNQIINAIKFLYEKVLNKKYDKVDFTRPRKEKKLPQVIEKEFLLDRINKIDNLKHKAIISLGYSVGLRVSEVINLKITDIDSKRMLIIIRQAKSRKDRVVPLSQTMLEFFRKYFVEFKPKEYLFNGQNSPKYSSTSCNQIVKKYIGKEYHFHLLRHSCFTNLLEQGVNLKIIQQIAGHSSSKTTEIYTHVSNDVLQKLPLAI